MTTKTARNPSRQPSNGSSRKPSRLGPRTRKFIGTILLATLALFYALIAVTVATYRLAEADAWVHFVYFTVTGMLWVVPAMFLIKWMIGQRGDYDDPGYVDEAYWQRLDERRGRGR